MVAIPPKWKLPGNSGKTLSKIIGVVNQPGLQDKNPLADPVPCFISEKRLVIKSSDETRIPVAPRL